MDARKLTPAAERRAERDAALQAAARQIAPWGVWRAVRGLETELTRRRSRGYLGPARSRRLRAVCGVRHRSSAARSAASSPIPPDTLAGAAEALVTKSRSVLLRGGRSNSQAAKARKVDMKFVQTGMVPVVCELNLEFELFLGDGPSTHDARRPHAGAAPCSVGLPTRQLSVSNRGTGQVTENGLWQHLASLSVPRLKGGKARCQGAKRPAASTSTPDGRHGEPSTVCDVSVRRSGSPPSSISIRRRHSYCWVPGWGSPAQGVALARWRYSSMRRSRSRCGTG